MAERNRWMEDLAGAILDGASIDWESEESTANHVDRPLLTQLRLLAVVADFHRRPRAANRPGHTTAVENAFAVVNGRAVVDGKYVLEGSLGHGGMGFVYRARHIELGKPFAVKLVQSHKSHRLDYRARFRIEAQALGRLNHPNIVQVSDFGVDPSAGPYLVMECIEGITLSEYVKHRRTLPLDEAVAIFSDIARALDYAHESGILHRDLKPANVLLVANGAARHEAKLVDFGIAAFLETAGTQDSAAMRPLPSDVAAKGLTATGTVLGTLEYIPPEVIQGWRASSAGDIYAFGILIYEVLVGRRPFEASIHERLNAHLHREVPVPSAVCASLPKELDEAILKPLHKDPLSRPVRARDVVVALREAWHRAQVRQWRRNELPKHIALSMAVAILVLLLHPFLQNVPPIQALDNTLLDLRVSLPPLRAPDSRIMLLSIDEPTLSADPRPLAEKADEVGTLLARVFDAGATSVAVDALLPEQWSRSEPFSALILDHGKHMVLASFSSPDGVRGPESIKGLVSVAFGRERIERLFGFVNLAADSDGVVRTMPLVFRDQDGRRVYSLAARHAALVLGPSAVDAFAASRLRIDYSIDWTKFSRVSWKDLPALLATQPEAFRDRVILVGGEFAGSGDIYNNVSSTALPAEVSGLVLQALTLNTLLEGKQIKKADETFVAVFLGVVTAPAVLALLFFSRSGWVIGIVAVGGVFYIALSFLAFRWTSELWPIAAPAVAFTLAIMCAALIRHALPPRPRL